MQKHTKFNFNNTLLKVTELLFISNKVWYFKFYWTTLILVSPVCYYPTNCICNDVSTLQAAAQKYTKLFVISIQVVQSEFSKFPIIYYWQPDLSKIQVSAV